MKEPVTRLDYCQDLLVSQINYTLTHFADHCERLSHDAIHRDLQGERLTPRLSWDHVAGQLIATPPGYIVFDDTVLDKHYSPQIALVRRQYSGNAKAIIKGIGVVTGVYVHPARDQFWLIDYRLYDPAGDGKSQLDHVHAMLSNVVYPKQRPCYAVLRDTWYATQDLMLAIAAVQKIYYGPLKNNRHVDDSGGQRPYGRVDSLTWSVDELPQGNRIKSRGCPKEHKVRLFRVEGSTHRTDGVVTNDPTQHSTQATPEVCGFRWKIEQLHRAGKQLTGLERCPCRQARIQRHHIGCAFLVWVRLTALAAPTGRTVYQLKHGLWEDYLLQQLKKPTLQMVLA